MAETVLNSAEAAPSPTLSDEIRLAFKGAMRRLASGVAVITANGSGGPLGLTATSVTSMCAEPPTVLVCVNKSASLHGALAVGQPICINLLSRDQQDVSGAFGGKLPPEERFAVGVWEDDHNGVPCLAGAQANISGVIDILMPYGTHSIVIARVEDVRLTGPVSPLIYQDGGYL